MEIGTKAKETRDMRMNITPSGSSPENKIVFNLIKCKNKYKYKFN